MSDIMELIKKYTTGEKNINRFIFFIVRIAVMLIFTGEEKQLEKPVSTGSESEKYIASVENDLCNILSKVSGAGKVEVMITLESGRETIYAWQEKSSKEEKSNSNENNNRISRQSEYRTEPVMIGSSGDKKALVEKTIEPVVRGVVVVCSGRDNIKVVSDITNAVSVVLNIPTNRVCVIKMQ